jgi:hypothetical protein
MIYEMFPQEYIELQKELMSGLHPKLEQILSVINADDIDMKLAHIAAYCEVVLDGTYDLDARRNLCDILTKRLVPMREGAKGILIVQ